MLKTVWTLSLIMLLVTACGKPRASRNILYVDQNSGPNYCSAHEVGKPFQSADGCNTCMCDASGRMACTLMACSIPN